MMWILCFVLFIQQIFKIKSYLPQQTTLDPSHKILHTSASPTTNLHKVHNTKFLYLSPCKPLTETMGWSLKIKTWMQTASWLAKPTMKTQFFFKRIGKLTSQWWISILLLSITTVGNCMVQAYQEQWSLTVFNLSASFYIKGLPSRPIGSLTGPLGWFQKTSFFTVVILNHWSRKSEKGLIPCLLTYCTIQKNGAGSLFCEDILISMHLFLVPNH